MPMPSNSDVQSPTLRFADHVELLQEFFLMRGVPFGSPGALYPLLDRLSASNSLHAEMSSMLRTIIYRESMGISRSELLEIASCAISGNRFGSESIPELAPVVNEALRSLHWAPATIDPPLPPPDESFPESNPESNPPPLEEIEVQPDTALLSASPPAANRSAPSLRARAAAVTIALRVRVQTLQDRASRWSLALPPIAPVYAAGASALLLFPIAYVMHHHHAAAVQPRLVASAAARPLPLAGRTPHPVPFSTAPTSSVPAQTLPVTLTPPSPAPSPATSVDSEALASSTIPELAPESTRRLRPERTRQTSRRLRRVNSTRGRFTPRSLRQPPTPATHTREAASIVPARAAAEHLPPSPAVSSAASFAAEAPPPAAHPIRDQGLFLLSSGIMSNNLLSSPLPEYPRLAALMHVQGQVVLQAIVSRDGDVIATHVLGGHRLLRGTAISAVRHWHYRPYLVDGHPADIATIITVDFRLPR